MRATPCFQPYHALDPRPCFQLSTKYLTYFIWIEIRCTSIINSQQVTHHSETDSGHGEIGWKSASWLIKIQLKVRGHKGGWCAVACNQRRPYWNCYDSRKRGAWAHWARRRSGLLPEGERAKKVERAQGVRQTKIIEPWLKTLSAYKS